MKKNLNKDDTENQNNKNNKQNEAQKPKGGQRKSGYMEETNENLEILKRDIKNIAQDINVAIWDRVEQPQNLRQYLKFKEEFDSIIKYSTGLFKNTPQSIYIYTRNLEEMIMGKEEEVIPEVTPRYFTDKMKFIFYAQKACKLENFKNVKSYMLHISKMLMIEPNNEELKDPNIHHKLEETIGFLISTKIWMANKKK